MLGRVRIREGVRDRCPGALTLHSAADGLLARVRLPGGLLPAAALRALGPVELTSRGNVQLRNVDPAIGELVASLGLLPSATHERVRNIVASPLAGLDRPGPRLDALVAELDAGLIGRPDLAGWPGRFLFGLDDGRGDILALRPDLAAVAVGDRWVLHPGAADVDRADVAAALLDAAEAFVRLASPAWRVAELPGGAAALGLRVTPSPPADPARPPAPASPEPPTEPAGRLSAAASPPGTDLPGPYHPDPPLRTEPVGPYQQPDGRWSVVVLAPLGQLTAAQGALLADHAAGPLRVTPWRSVVVADLPDPAPLLATASEAGLGVTTTSPWYGLSACTGRPGCASALADVRADAAASCESGSRGRVHWSGCERRCGRPGGAHLEMLATPTGYRAGWSA